MKKIYLIALTLLLLSACGSHIKIRLESAPTINPTISNLGAPVQIKLYLLTDPSQFNAGTFYDLWLHDKATLNKTLLFSKDIILAPDSQIKFKLPYVRGSHYIAAVAIFRKPDIRQWRVIQKIRRVSRFKTLTIVVKESKLLLTH